MTTGAVPANVHGGVVVGSALPPGDMRVGIHPNPDAAEPVLAGEFGVERLWDTGAIWCRLNPQPGVWDFTPLISQLDAAAMRRAQAAVVVLGFPPSHAVQGVPNPGEAPWLCPQPGYASLLPSDAVWDDYVMRTVAEVHAWRLGHPQVAVHFQVWNEPAVRWFLAADQQPQRLVQLAIRARSIVRATMPDAYLISPSIVAERARWQQRFVVEAARQIVFDVWSVHLYPRGSTFDEVWADYAWAMDDVTARIAPGRQLGDRLWITEINANIAVQGPPRVVLPDADQARFVEAVAGDAAGRGIDTVVWYRWHYDPYLPGSGQIVLSGQSAAMSALRRGG